MSLAVLRNPHCSSYATTARTGTPGILLKIPETRGASAQPVLEMQRVYRGGQMGPGVGKRGTEVGKIQHRAPWLSELCSWGKSPQGLGNPP